MTDLNWDEKPGKPTEPPPWFNALWDEYVRQCRSEFKMALGPQALRGVDGVFGEPEEDEP